MARITAELRLDSKLLADYLHYVFRREPDTGALVVSSTGNIGKFLIAHLKGAAEPVTHLPGENVVTLDFPEGRATWDLIDKWCYYDSADQRRINYLLKAVFDVDFISYYRKAEGLGLPKKSIVEAFITSRRLCSADNFDALHKKVYRYQRKVFDSYTKMLSNRVAYIEKIGIGG